MFMLKPHPPYDFQKLLALLRCYPYATLDRVHESAYRRVFRVEGRLSLVEITSEGTVDQAILQGRCLVGNPETALLEKIRHVLDTGSGRRAAFFQMARQDKKLQPVVGDLYGLPLLRTEDVFEALVTTLIEQQIAWKAALRAQRWLLEWANQAVEYQGEMYYAFPTPQQIATATIDDLKPLKITFRRMEFLISTAQKIVSGELTSENLSTYESLLKIKGIGHWTAAVILSRAFGHRHQITDNDAALQAAVNRYFYGEKGRATPQALIDAFAAYDGFAGDAALYTLLRWVFDEYP